MFVQWEKFLLCKNFIADLSGTRTWNEKLLVVVESQKNNAIHSLKEKHVMRACKWSLNMDKGARNTKNEKVSLLYRKQSSEKCSYS